MLWITELNNYVNNYVTIKIYLNILVVASAGVLYRLNATTGEVLTKKQITSHLEAILTTLNTYTNLAITNSEKKILAFDRNNLHRVWKSTKLGQRFDAVEVLHHHICVACNSQVFVFLAKDGELVWNEVFEGPRKAITLLKDDSTDPHRPVLYVGFCGKVYTLDILSKKRIDQIFHVCADETFGISMLLYKGILFVSGQGIISAYKDNSLLWIYEFGPETGYDFYSSIHATRFNEKEIVLIGSHGYVVAFDILTGSKLWILSLPYAGYKFVSLLYYQDCIYIASNGKMFGVDSEGKILWTITIPGTQPFFLLTSSSNCNNSDHPIIQSDSRSPSFSIFR